MDNDLFALDEYDGPGATSASFTTSRFPAVDGDSDEELDEAEGPLVATAADLLTLLHREAAQLGSEHPGKAIVPRFCEWLVQTGLSEHEIASGVTRSLAATALSTAATLRETVGRFDPFGQSAEKLALEEQMVLLQWEASTWELLHTTLTDLRQAEGQENSMALSMAAGDKWVSDEQFFQMCSRMDPAARRFRRVAAWLEHVYNTQSSPSGSVRAEHNWEATERCLSKGVATEKDALTGAETELVSRLDPDAPLRQSGSLHSVDETIDKRLLRRVWELIRCGRIGQAVTECNACQQQWRSATLMGMQPYHDPKVLNQDDPADARGNNNAALLRQVCAQMADCVKLNAHERAMYALFAGRIDPVLSVSSSYHDVLWAHYKINLLQRVLQLRGNFELQVLADEEMFAAAAAAFPEQAQTVHARIQKAMILGQLNELAQLLSDYQRLPDCSPHIHRFSVSALLVLSKVRTPYFNPTPELLLADAHFAIGVYLNRVVAALHKPAIVVALALHLPAAGRSRFVARFVADSVEGRSVQEARELEAITLIAEDERVRDAARKQDRRTRYVQAIEAGGLEIADVLQHVFVNLLPPESAHVRAFHFNNQDDSAVDTMGSHAALIEILGWLTIRSDHWKQSVEVANSISRHLALRHRVSHIRDVLRTLPSLTLDQCRSACLTEPRATSSYAFEIEFWRALCDAYDAFATWHNSQSRSDSQATAALYEGAEGALRRVVDFPTAPLFDLAAGGIGGERYRQAQLAVIRDNYIPQVFVMLHALHCQSGRPELSLALADDVADKRKNLWSVFARTEMLEPFLGLMKEASTMLLARGHRCIVGFDALE